MNSKVLKLVYTAVMAALICVFTMIPQIPVPATNGYIHMGDTLIFVAVYLIGIYAVPAAAIGSMFADLFSGYVHFMLPTFIIKGLVALVCYLVVRKRETPAFQLLGSVSGAIVMVLGYFVAENIMAGMGNAVAAMGANTIQGAAGIVLSMAIVSVLSAVKFKRKIGIR